MAAECTEVEIHGRRIEKSCQPLGHPHVQAAAITVKVIQVILEADQRVWERARIVKPRHDSAPLFL